MKAFDLARPIKDQLHEQQLFRRRAWAGFLIILLCLLALGSRYFYLQVLRHQDYVTRSNSNRVHVQTVAPNRGLIYDRRGRVIADNQPAFRLEVIPERVGDMPRLLEEISALVPLTADEITRFNKARSRYRDFDAVPLRFNLSESEVAQFAVNQHLFEGVDVVPYLTRNYPYGDLLTHVLGYVGRIDEQDLAQVNEANYRATTHIGKNGIERYYESQLHGVSGEERVETNVRGRVLKVIERQDPQAGSDLILSVDVAVQRAAWDALGDRAGSVVALDPRDGSVIALVSKPAYDPNLFVHGISNADYQAILAEPGRPLFNRALNGGYEPGSTFKPFIGLAGLELGVIGPDQRIFSNGEYYLPNYDRPYRDWKKGGHGWVTISTALEQSVNTYFYRVAHDLGIDRIHAYLSQFGFGKPTGIDVPGESGGLLPSREWKRGRFNQPWYPGETVISGIGQGFNVVTPIQLANALAALVNGGRLMVPRLVFAVKEPIGGQAQRIPAPLATQIPVVARLDWDAVLEGLRLVVNGPRGTARDVALDTPYVIAGKTGTAQVFALARDRDQQPREVAEHLRDHALFVAFAPFEDPRIVIAVVVDNGGAGSRVAAPIARATLDAWLEQEILQ